MKQVYWLCNAHIDPVWQWDWEEGLTIYPFINKRVNR